MLRARDPFYMLVQTLAGFMMITMISFREMDRNTFPCGLYVAATNIFLPFYFLPIFIRATALDYRYSFSMLDLDDQHINSSNYIENVKRRRGLSLAICAVVMSLHITLAAVQMSLAPNPLGTGCGFNTEVEFMIFAGVAFVYAVAFGLVIWKLQNIHDHYKVAKELRGAFSWSLVFTVIFFVLNLTPGLWELDKILPFSAIIMLMIFGLHIITTVIPIMKSTDPDYIGVTRIFLDESSRTFVKVEEYIGNPTAMSALREYCIKEQIHEPLDKYIQLCHLMATEELEKRYSDANLIQAYTISQNFPIEYRKLIGEGQINDVHVVLNCNGTPTNDMFANYLLAYAQYATERCVMRFRQTPQYDKLLESSKRDALIASREEIDFNND